MNMKLATVTIIAIHVALEIESKPQYIDCNVCKEIPGSSTTIDDKRPGYCFKFQIKWGPSCDTRPREWYYNFHKGHCELRDRSVCHMNDNHFDSEGKCESVCGEKGDNVIRGTGGEIESKPQYIDCNVCKEIPGSSTTIDDKRPGYCFKFQIKWGPSCDTRPREWYYNFRKGHCELRDRSVCHMNDNHFDSEGKCERICGEKGENVIRGTSGNSGDSFLEHSWSSGEGGGRFKVPSYCYKFSFESGSRCRGEPTQWIYNFNHRRCIRKEKTCIKTRNKFSSERECMRACGGLDNDSREHHPNVVSSSTWATWQTWSSSRNFGGGGNGDSVGGNRGDNKGHSRGDGGNNGVHGGWRSRNRGNKGRGGSRGGNSGNSGGHRGGSEGDGGDRGSSRGNGGSTGGNRGRSRGSSGGNRGSGRGSRESKRGSYVGSSWSHWESWGSSTGGSDTGSTVQDNRPDYCFKFQIKWGDGCDHPSRVWHYNSHNGHCKFMNKPVCPMNRNHFHSKKECERICGKNGLNVERGGNDGYSKSRWNRGKGGGESKGDERSLSKSWSSWSTSWSSWTSYSPSVSKGQKFCYSMGYYTGRECDGEPAKWTYDCQSGKCNKHKQGLCFRTENNFESESKCMSSCGGSQARFQGYRSKTDGGKPKFCTSTGYYSGSKCEDEPSRWTFDGILDKCIKQPKGLCFRNGNRFQSKAGCEKVCGK